MIGILDASVAVTVILDPARENLPAFGEYSSLAAPSHFDIECLSALRRFRLRGLITQAELAIFALAIQTLPVARYPISPLVPRITALAPNASVYDAAYIALAEVLDAELITADARLASVPGIRCRVRVL